MKGLIFTYALTYGGAALSLFRPYYGLLIYICFATIRPDFLWHWSVPEGGNYSRIVAIALLIGWTLAGFGSWSFGGAKAILWALAAYWCCILLSAIFAPHQSVAWAYVELHTKILLPVAVGLTLIDSPGKLRALAWVMVLSLGYLALEGNLDHWQGGFRVRQLGMGGMDNNSFCIAMVTGAGVAFFLGVAESKWWLKLIAFALAGLMVHVPLFGNSRGGMLALVALAAVAFFLLPKRPRHLVAYAAGLLIALRLAGPQTTDRFSTVFLDPEERDASAASRMELWSDCWDAMQKHPLTGLGPDHWPIAAKEQYGWPTAKEAHSIWFNAGAELGFPGLAGLLTLYGLTGWRSIRLLRQEGGDAAEVKPYARMVLAGLAGFAVAACFVALDALEPPYHLVLLGAAAVKVADLRGESLAAFHNETPEAIVSPTWSFR